MALEIKLVSIYNTAKGKLRAKVKYSNKVHTLKINRNSSSLISMPVGFTSFIVDNIINNDINKNVSIRLIKDGQIDKSINGLVNLDLIASQFI